MKTCLPLLSVIFNTALALSSIAQDQGAAEVKSAADPFTRDGNAATERDKQAPARPYLLYGLVEYIEVPTDAWLAYVAKHPVHHDATELRAETQRWIVEGKAKPFEITCVPTRSGNRMVVESILERRYPIEYLPAYPRPVPSFFETRNTYFTFEWEPVGELGGKWIDVVCVPNLVSYAGEIPMPSTLAAAPKPGDPTQPRFTTAKVSFADSLLPDVPVLCGVTTPSDSAGNRREKVRLLCFFRAAAVPNAEGGKVTKPPMLQYLQDGKPASMPSGKWDELLKAAASDPSAKAKADAIREQLRQGSAKLGTARLTFEVQRLEVKLGDLNAWFAAKPLETATSGLQTAALKWIGEGRGRIADARAGNMLSGNRSVWEDIQEIRYVSEYEVEGNTPPIQVPHEVQPKSVEQHVQILNLKRPAKITMLKDPAVSPGAIETRNAGFTIEMEPVLRPESSTVDLQIATNDTRLAGYAPYYQREVNGKLETAIEQPIFASMKISTNVILSFGVPNFLGMHTPMEEDMKPSADRRILTFVTVRD